MVLKPFSDSIGKGDVVVYFLDGKLIVHRIVRVKHEAGERIFRTKGDSSLCLDARPVAESEIVGRVVAVKRGERTIDLRSGVWRAWGRLATFCSYGFGLVMSWLSAWRPRPPRTP